jgi:hypothetical protein
LGVARSILSLRDAAVAHIDRRWLRLRSMAANPEPARRDALSMRRRARVIPTIHGPISICYDLSLLLH